MKTLLLTLLTSLLLSAFSFAVHAQSSIYLCVDANGKKEYRNSGSRDSCELVLKPFDIESIGSASTKSPPTTKPSKRWEFVSYAKMGESVWYDSTTQHGKSIPSKVWVVMDSTAKKTISASTPESLVNQYLVDCPNRRLTLTISESYSDKFGTGELIDKSSPNRIIDVKPDSVLDILMTKLCR